MPNLMPGRILSYLKGIQRCLEYTGIHIRVCSWLEHLPPGDDRPMQHASFEKQLILSKSNRIIFRKMRCKLLSIRTGGKFMSPRSTSNTPEAVARNPGI